MCQLTTKHKLESIPDGSKSTCILWAATLIGLQEGHPQIFKNKSADISLTVRFTAIVGIINHNHLPCMTLEAGSGVQKYFQH